MLPRRARPTRRSRPSPLTVVEPQARARRRRLPGLQAGAGRRPYDAASPRRLAATGNGFFEGATDATDSAIPGGKRRSARQRPLMALAPRPGAACVGALFAPRSASPATASDYSRLHRSSALPRAAPCPPQRAACSTEPRLAAAVGAQCASRSGRALSACGAGPQLLRRPNAQRSSQPSSPPAIRRG